MAATSDAEHYDSERATEETEVSEKADIQVFEVAEVFQSYRMTTEESTLPRRCGLVTRLLVSVQFCTDIVLLIGSRKLVLV
jgi:hypothetical protein